MKIWFDNFRHSRGVQGKSRDGHEVMHQPNPSHSLPSSIWTPSLRFSFIKWCLEAIMAPKPGNSHIFTHKWSCKFTDIIWNNIIFGRGLVWFPANMNASVLYGFLSNSRRTKQSNNKLCGNSDFYSKFELLRIQGCPVRFYCFWMKIV